MVISWLSDKPASKDWLSLHRKPAGLAAAVVVVVVDNVVAKFDNKFVKFPAIFKKSLKSFSRNMNFFLNITAE